MNNDMTRKPDKADDRVERKELASDKNGVPIELVNEADKLFQDTEQAANSSPTIAKLLVTIERVAGQFFSWREKESEANERTMQRKLDIEHDNVKKRYALALSGLAVVSILGSAGGITTLLLGQTTIGASIISATIAGVLGLLAGIGLGNRHGGDSS